MNTPASLAVKARSLGLVVAVLAAAFWALIPRVGAQDLDAMFEPHRNERIIAEQVRLALPPAVRGYQMLSAAADEEEEAGAVRVLYESYRYLRAAQQGSEMVYTSSKIRDPFLKLRIQRVWDIRVSLLHCIDHKGHLLEAANPTRSTCLDGLPVGIKKLRLLVETTP